MKEKKIKTSKCKKTVRMLSYVKICLNGHWFVYERVYVCK